MATSFSPKQPSLTVCITASLCTIIVLTIGLICLNQSNSEVPELPSAVQSKQFRVLPPPREQQDSHYRKPLPLGSLHSLVMTHENGRKVVKIVVVENGDEFIVDAHTGKLIETRPTTNIPIQMKCML
ncbi:MAG: hypothetical protein R3B84_04890 [Zavarzinella sp.]